MGRKRLTLREALASDQLEDFVQQEEACGAELAKGSDLERALALLVTTRHRSDARSLYNSLWTRLRAADSSRRYLLLLVAR